eukprot:366491-Chlamydomonas_euryale.AAC.2
MQYAVRPSLKPVDSCKSTDPAEAHSRRKCARSRVAQVAQAGRCLVRMRGIGRGGGYAARPTAKRAAVRPAGRGLQPCLRRAMPAGTLACAVHDNTSWLCKA